MKTIAIFLFAIVGLSLAAWDSSYVSIEEQVKDQYIFTFKEGLSEELKSQFLVSLKNEAYNFGVDNRILKEYRIGDFHAILVKGSKSFVEYTLYLMNPLMKHYSPDGIATIDQECRRFGSEAWGLARISHRSLGHLTQEFVHDGTGVNAYIIDTGIYIEHHDFSGRAVWGKTFTADKDEDCNGHGTHVAGIIGSNTYGVAKNVQLIAVKVLNCFGSGTFGGIIEGIQWVTEQHKLKGKPSVANMSLGGSLNIALDEAVEAMIKQGVSTSVSAGNSNMDACDHSVRTDYAITTGSSTFHDERSSFSNYGSCVDVFSPGSDIVSTYIGGPKSIKSLSGTSMASPHSAGLSARILSESPSLTPLEVKKRIIDNATKNVLNLKCTNQVCEASPNLLAYGGCQ